MDTDILDAIGLGDVAPKAGPGSTSLCDLTGFTSPADVARRLDVFRHHRDRIAGNIVGLNFSWATPASMLYDWYQSASGMTVSLESLWSVSRVRPALVTVRVRHSDPEQDGTILKLGLTYSIHPDAADANRARLAILDAIANGESPLWRLATTIGVPSWVEAALKESIRDGDIVGYLDLKTADRMILAGLVTEEAILDAMGVRRSPYHRRLGYA